MPSTQSSSSITINFKPISMEFGASLHSSILNFFKVFNAYLACEIKKNSNFYHTSTLKMQWSNPRSIISSVFLIAFISFSNFEVSFPMIIRSSICNTTKTTKFSSTLIYKFRSTNDFSNLLSKKYGSF